MKMPGSHRAVVDDSKVRDYLLCAAHPMGQSKAAYFNRLGFSRADWPLLRVALLSLAEQDAQPTVTTIYGQKFSIRGVIRGPTGKLGTVETIWMFANKSMVPRLITVIPRMSL